MCRARKYKSVKSCVWCVTRWSTRSRHMHDLATPLLNSPPRRARRRHYLFAAIILSATALSIFVITAAQQLPSASQAASFFFTPPPPPPLRILITGYLPWGNMTTLNPADEVATTLNSTCHPLMSGQSVCFDGMALSVNRDGAKQVARILAAVPVGGAAPWDAILHLGLESIATGLRFEIAAANILSMPGNHGWSADVPCNKSSSASNSSGYHDIVEGGPCLLATTAPLDRLYLDDSVGVVPPPAELWSRDAGTFYCNEVLYRSLYQVRTRLLRPARLAASEPHHHHKHHAASDDAAAWPLLPVVFIHLPSINTSTPVIDAEVIRRLAVRMVGEAWK